MSLRDMREDESSAFPVFKGYVRGDMDRTRRYEVYVWQGRRFLRDTRSYELVDIGSPGSGGPVVVGINRATFTFNRNATDAQ